MANPEQICIICREQIEERSGQEFALGMCDCKGPLDLKHYYCVADLIVANFDDKCRQCDQHFNDPRIRRDRRRSGGLRSVDVIIVVFVNLINFGLIVVAFKTNPIVDRTVLIVLDEDNNPYLKTIWQHKKPIEPNPFPNHPLVDNMGRPIDNLGNYIEAQVVKRDINVQLVGGEGGHESDFGPDMFEWFDVDTQSDEEWYESRTGPKKRKRIRRGKRNRRTKPMGLEQLFSRNEE